MKNLTDCTKVMVRSSSFDPWMEAYRDCDGLFYDLRGNEIHTPWEHRSGWDFESSGGKPATEEGFPEKTDPMMLMVCNFERGMTVQQKDGDGAIAPSGEAYVTFALQLSLSGRHDNYTHDPKGELIAALGGVLDAYKKDRLHHSGKYLRWRVRPNIESHPGIMTIRCRVLISADITTLFEIVRHVETVTETPPEPLHYPIPEPCSSTFQIVPGWLGASGKFYDEYGVPLRKPPVGWGPRQ